MRLFHAGYYYILDGEKEGHRERTQYSTRVHLFFQAFLGAVRSLSPRPPSQVFALRFLHRAETAFVQCPYLILKAYVTQPPVFGRGINVGGKNWGLVSS